MPTYLSKSDFKVARDCLTKLYYKKQRYPSCNDEDEYLMMLAEGGYMVEKIAKLLFPEGREIGFDGKAEDAFQATMEALKADNVTLFEATLIINGKLARVDILRKRGKEIHLIEVKAKSYDNQEDAEARRNGRLNIFRRRDGRIYPDWQDYLEDVTFQSLVVQELFPKHTVHAFLCMPDKAKTTKIDRLYAQFTIRRIQEPGSSFQRLVVDFTGDAAQLRKDHFLSQVNVDAEVQHLSEDVKGNAKKYLASLTPRLKKMSVPLTTACNGCEYRANDGDPRDGFKECWGNLADVSPHLFELYFVSDIGRFNGITADDLIQSRKVNLLEIPKACLMKSDGTVGERNRRQLIQVEHTRDNTEWISKNLKKIIQSWKYPLQFIDFETTALAVPYHAGLHPYEPVAFQWSCHTLEKPEGELKHSQWINVVDAFPNFEFAESLMKQIGTAGTVFMWATHENTILTRILDQMGIRRYKNKDLQSWLQTVATKGWLVDMNQLTLKHYFHPLIKGKTSIKRVVDAIWKTSPKLREGYPEYLREQDGQFLSPYEALPPLKIQDQEVVIAEGTGAMRAYEAMLYGLEKDDAEIREQWRKLLLQYCKLDTASMVMIWQHWCQKLGIKI